jgi:SAM-dependent methyltransferase
MTRLYSKFAIVDDLKLPEYAAIIKDLDQLNAKYELSDHTDLNASRYPWSVGMLRRPAFYAARLWEYPFAILAADLEPEMKVADIGCGMTAFTIYLKDHAGCDIVGVDPDVFEAGTKYYAHGVSREFMDRTGLKIVKGEFDEIPLPNDSQDRVFCISVMEHVPPDVRRRGMQEIARILKPGGKAILTVDVSMWFELNRPLDLIWESGLTLVEPADLRWPVQRFGMFDSKQPADVFGMTLLKEDRQIETLYRCAGNDPVESVPAYRVPTLIPRAPGGKRPLWRRVGGSVLRELKRTE